MTAAEWSELAVLLENGWPGEFDEFREAAYFALLGDFDGAAVQSAIVGLAHEGCRFRPSAAEIAAVCARPPWERLSWPEASRLLFAALSRHYDPIRGVDGMAAIAELHEIHPAVALFAAAQGARTLATEPVDDPDIGGAVRKRLEEAWDLHTIQIEDRWRRGVALDPAGDAIGLISDGRQPRRLDYRRAVAELESSGSSGS